ncbi:hypothetical protein [Streptomyces sp. NPDC056480]|uniref:hypothetical protein n=1 Tax=Streptomyces sp. NPDC056480 TaxID=3345833 RepID=UPI0036AAEF0C
MSASEKNGHNPIPWTRPYVVRDYPDITEAYDPDTAEGFVLHTSEWYDSDAADVYGELSVLPDRFPESAGSPAQAARGAGNALWAAVRAHKAMTAGAAAGAAAALTLAYALGRRARRREPGPVALLLERRF